LRNRGKRVILYIGCTCDRCGKEFRFTAITFKYYIPNKTRFIKLARENGWSMGRYTLCPYCKKMNLKEKEKENE